jgi:lipopolysaccharide transport system ATP-binding protein
MTAPVIEAQGLSKRYILQQPATGFGSGLAGSARWLRRMFGSAPRPKPMPTLGAEFWALKDVSFSVSQGDVVGIVGKNGAGKTSLLKILARITAPTAGIAKVRGRVGSILEIGTGFNPSLTGLQNVFLSAAILGMREEETRQRLEEIVEFSGVGKFIDVPVKHYSSGMYARLAFSVVAHLRHEILLIDEVLAVGDASFQKKCVGKLHGEATSGRTVLFVSHNLASVASLCNRALLLEEGRITLDGPPGAVIDTYLGRLKELQATSIWESPDVAPGNSVFRLHAVRVTDAAGRPGVRHANSNDVLIEMEYWNLREGSRLGATIAVFNPAGLCVFGSLSNHEPRWHGQARPRGLFRSTCRIPGNLMMDGIYTLSVLLWADHYTEMMRFDRVAEFEITDSGSLRGDYFGGWEGCILPQLEWTCEHVEADRALASVSGEHG